ncbi:MAG: tetratricopeptide repeat protein, partial [Pyrinomonadaceae bacterium]
GITPVLNNLGNLYKDKGDYVTAELLYQRAFDIRERSLEPDHLLIASSLNSLANIKRTKGEDDKATALYRRALEIREKALGPEHPEVATSLNNLANTYNESDADYDKAEPLYRRALAIREKVLGPEHPDVAQTLYNLVVYYGSKGDYARAEPLCRRALSILEKSLGPEHPYISYSLNALAIIAKNTGDYARAESLYRRAIAIKEKGQGPYHPEVGGSLTNLANLYAVKGEVDKAVATQSRANDILERNIALNLAVGSERQKLAYVASLSEITDRTLTLHLRTAPNNSEAAGLALTTVLQRKGRVLDAMSDSLGALRRRLDKRDQSLFDQLSEATAKLVGLVLSGPQDTAPAEHPQQITALEERRERLESEISRRSAGFYEQSKPVTPDAVRAAIPAGAALIEFATYRPVAPTSHEFAPARTLDTNAVGSPRYVAYVIRGRGDVRWAELGEAREIDGAIDEWREALRDPSRKDVRQLARAVDERVMRPVRAFVGDAAQLLVSPDGELNLIPFEALVDERHRFLVERYAFTYLTSGRDLLR